MGIYVYTGMHTLLHTHIPRHVCTCVYICLLHICFCLHVSLAYFQTKQEMQKKQWKKLRKEARRKDPKAQKRKTNDRDIFLNDCQILVQNSCIFKDNHTCQQIHSFVNSHKVVDDSQILAEDCHALLMQSCTCQ